VARKRSVDITLVEPYSPFLTEALARLPILSQTAVKAATAELLDAADGLGENRPDKLVDRITTEIIREECSNVDPPPGCLLTGWLPDLKRVIGKARMELPSTAPFTDETGLFDESGYATELLDRVGVLAEVFTTDGADRVAAALSLVDVTRTPLGSGPFVLDRIEDGTYFLDAHREHPGGPPAIAHVEIHVERNPSEAVTRLLSGQADWILEVSRELAPVVNAVPGVAAAPRPLTTQRGILFNVRPDRLYFDVRARRAFAACLDREALVKQLDTERVVATTPYAAGTWATPEAEPWPHDTAAGNALLDEAGWQMATDGVRIKDGVRLSTTIAVRPSGIDLFTFANAAAAQLSDCGIELIVVELDLTGDTMLTQLQWPNDFDTLLMSRPLSFDPDMAVRMFESSRITTEENQADANPSGFTSALADFHIDDARQTIDLAARADDYASVQGLLDEDIPYWPLWYDTSLAAISTRVSDPDGPIDPARPRYDWDVASWRLDS
jgi:ABC-type transport system substrate-binding protein